MIEVATALLFDSEGKLLIYLRDDKTTIPFPNCWDLFGGHVDPGETPAIALVREIQEELGIDLDQYTAFRTYNCMQGDAQPNVKHVYTAQINKRAQELTLYEGQRHEGIDLDERHNYRFANILGTIIDDYVAYLAQP
jgi:8-oxo-dGTP diphosphatase